MQDFSVQPIMECTADTCELEGKFKQVFSGNIQYDTGTLSTWKRGTMGRIQSMM